MRHAIGYLVVLAGICGCGSAASATAAAAPHLISIDDAKKVLATYDQVNASVATTEDPAPLAKVEAGWGLQMDTASYNAARAAQTPPDVATPSNEKVFVPHQSSYPGFFMVSATQTASNGPANQLLIFESAKQGAPWLMVWETWLINNTTMPALTTGADGYVELTDPKASSTYLMDPADVAANLATYYNDSLSAGKPKPDAQFAPGPDTSTFVQNVSQNVQQLAAQHEQATHAFDAARVPYYVAFKCADGSALTLPVLTSVNTYSVSQGYTLTQDAKRQNYGGLLAPGDYTSITFKDIMIPIAQIPAKGASTTKVSILGYSDQAVDVSGS